MKHGSKRGAVLAVCSTALLMVLGLAALLLFAVGTFLYRTAWAKTEVMTVLSPDGEYRLEISMEGEPDWPFGPTHCRFDLWEGRRRIAKHRFLVRNDGVAVSPNQFSVRWFANHAAVAVSGEEQPDVMYRLYWDGTVAEAHTDDAAF